MYAVIEIGGKQYKVEQGQDLLVEKVFTEDEKTSTLKPLMIVDDKGKIDMSGKGSIKVSIIEHTRGPKVIAFKYKPKKGYSRKIGHRQDLVRIKVDKIAGGTTKKTAKASEKEVETQEVVS